jgi:hydroxymethylpyrimidine pyrophosphatase-like HAD family hydrolase
MATLYVDVDGTLVAPGGDLFWQGSTRLAEALVRARAHDLELVPVTGRGRLQVRELCRLLGLARGLAELGCVHLEGPEVRYELGGFPLVGETPVEAMRSRGVIELVTGAGTLESHEPWNEGREATFILRGRADTDEVNRLLADHGFDWCVLVDNGAFARRPGQHAYHLAPAGTGKAAGVAIDIERHGLDRAGTAYVGDAASDLECAAVVGECWLVANAEAALEWPLRTESSYGDGVAEVIDRLLSG